jgi:competence CoiA-like predicted nuclease
MLSCLYNGKPFNNNEDGYNEYEIKKLGRDKQLLCPYCNASVFYNGQGKITSHFKHYKGTSCETEKKLRRYDDYDNESHKEIISMVQEWMAKQYADQKIIKDMYFPEINQKSDLYLEINEIKVSIEIQIKHKNFDQLIDKRNAYKTIGVKDIWIFVNYQEYNPGSPYERHYYQSNNRELYYINPDDFTFTYYKGLKCEKFNQARVPLEKYIMHNCNMDEVRLNTDGILVLPNWSELYSKYIHDYRDSIHRHIREKRAKLELERRKAYLKEQERLRREKEKEELQEVLNYQIKTYILSLSEKISLDFLPGQKEFKIESFTKIGDNNISTFYLEVCFGENKSSKYKVLRYDIQPSVEWYICKSIRTSKGFYIKYLPGRRVCYFTVLMDGGGSI